MNNSRLARLLLVLGLLVSITLAIVCRTDKRSEKAALLLTEEGFHNVHVVRGGMTKWIDAELLSVGLADNYY